MLDEKQGNNRSDNPCKRLEEFNGGYNGFLLTMDALSSVP